RDYEYQLIPEFEYTYLLLHLARHMRTSGVGIRSLLDINIYLNQFNDLDSKLTNDFLTKTNIVIFEEKVKQINKVFTNQIDLDKDLEEVIDYIMKSGIHGNGSEHDFYLSKRAFVKTR